MSAIKRYEAAADRARFLYRIPTAPNSNRTLELYHAGEPLLGDGDWPGIDKTLCRIGPDKLIGSPEDSSRANRSLTHLDFRRPLPFADQSFDLVILHRILDDLAALPKGESHKFDPALFLENVSAVLAPDGIVAGCVNNRWSLKALTHKLKQLATPARDTRPLSLFTLRNLNKALSVAGYSDIRLFTLLPNCSAPSKLIDTDPVVSRMAFRNELKITHQVSLTPGYLVRRAMVELGMNRLLEDSIFFWASKS